MSKQPSNCSPDSSEARRRGPKPGSTHRVYTDEFKKEAVALLLDGFTPQQVADRLAIPNRNVLYKWKTKFAGPEIVTGQGLTKLAQAVGVDEQVLKLKAEVRRLEQERDILKKALIVFGRGE